MKELTEVQKRILETVAGLKDRPETGAFNLRLNGQGDTRRSTKTIRIDPKTDNPGIEIHLSANASTAIRTFSFSASMSVTFSGAFSSHSAISLLLFSFSMLR